MTADRDKVTTMCPGFCTIVACDWCGEMAFSHNDGPLACELHPDAPVVTLRRESCPHGPSGRSVEANDDR